MPHIGNRAYGLAGVERKQSKRLRRRRNKGLPPKRRRRQVKDRQMALRLTSASNEPA